MRDALGNVRTITDSTASVQESRQYSPYGETYGTTGSNQSTYGFTGEPTDSNGMLYLRARYYNPTIGQFINLDPAETANRYAYTMGNPVNRTDPTGMYACYDDSCSRTAAQTVTYVPHAYTTAGGASGTGYTTPISKLSYGQSQALRANLSSPAAQTYLRSQGISTPVAAAQPTHPDFGRTPVSTANRLHNLSGAQRTADPRMVYKDMLKEHVLADVNVAALGNDACKNLKLRDNDITYEEDVIGQSIVYTFHIPLSLRTENGVEILGIYVANTIDVSPRLGVSFQQRKITLDRDFNNDSTHPVAYTHNFPDFTIPSMMFKLLKISIWGAVDIQTRQVIFGLPVMVKSTCLLNKNFYFSPFEGNEDQTQVKKPPSLNPGGALIGTGAQQAAQTQAFDPDDTVVLVPPTTNNPTTASSTTPQIQSGLTDGTSGGSTRPSGYGYSYTSVTAATSCFTADTQVWLANGATKSIDQIKVGEAVLARDGIAGAIAPQRVSRIWKHHVSRILVLHLENDEYIETTPEHRFAVVGQGFIDAGKIALGSQVMTENHLDISVVGKEILQTHTTVYNLTVEEFHTYFVGPAGILVHNIKNPTKEYEVLIGG